MQTFDVFAVSYEFISERHHVMRHVVEHRKRANRMREVCGLGLMRLQVERQSALEHVS